MDFEKIKNGSQCDCLKGSEIDIEGEYIRKIKKDIVLENDFQTHWERGLHRDENDCDKICSYKSVSINKILSDSLAQIMNKYKITFRFNPAKGFCCARFKLRENAGKVKHSPTNIDPTHYNFFKADDFTLDSINITEIIKFTE